MRLKHIALDMAHPEHTIADLDKHAEVLRYVFDSALKHAMQRAEDFAKARDAGREVSFESLAKAISKIEPGDIPE